MDLFSYKIAIYDVKIAIYDVEIGDSYDINRDELSDWKKFTLSIEGLGSQYSPIEQRDIPIERQDVSNSYVEFYDLERKNSQLVDSIAMFFRSKYISETINEQTGQVIAIKFEYGKLVKIECNFENFGLILTNTGRSYQYRFIDSRVLGLDDNDDYDDYRWIRIDMYDVNYIFIKNELLDNFIQNIHYCFEQAMILLNEELKKYIHAFMELNKPNFSLEYIDPQIEIQEGRGQDGGRSEGTLHAENVGTAEASHDGSEAN